MSAFPTQSSQQFTFAIDAMAPDAGRDAMVHVRRCYQFDNTDPDIQIESTSNGTTVWLPLHNTWWL